MGKFSTDQKLQLVQKIREENRDNRIRMRSRERLLYGGGRQEEELPLYNKGYHDYGKGREQELYALEEHAGRTEEVPFSSFRLRLVIAAALFTAFLLADAGSGSIAGVSTATLWEEINKDFDAGLDEVVFDFENNFPYTLFRGVLEEQKD